MGLVHVVWFAVAISYAIDLAFRGLVAFGLMPSEHLGERMARGITTRSALFLWVALAWSATSAILGLVTYRLVAAVMAGYQPFVAVALAAAAGWAFPTAGAFVAPGVDALTGQTPADAPLVAATRMIELVLGFFATHAALGVDWGRASRSRSDIEAGGWAGIAMAAMATGCLALLIVAGVQGRRAGPAVDELVAPGPPRAGVAAARSASPDPADFTVREALSAGLGPGPFAGALMITMSVGLLGPACFAPILIARFLGMVGPGVPRWAWSLGGALAAWPLIALRVPERLDLVFSALGVAVAPLLGVIAAGWTRSKGRGRAIEGVHLPALIAWAAAAVLGAALAFGPTRPGPLVPTLAAYAAAWLAGYLVHRRPGGADRSAGDAVTVSDSASR
jgi:hypothetical protein